MPGNNRTGPLTCKGEDLPRYEDPLPDFAKAWVDYLEQRYSHWPAGSVRAFVELYLAKPEAFTPENIEAWAKTELPPELKNTPKEGVITNIPVGTPEHAAIEAKLEQIRQEHTSEIVPAITEGDEQEH